MSSNDKGPLMTVEEVAALLGFHRMTVYEKVTNGEIPHLRIGRAIRFDRDDILHWLSERKEAAA